MADEVWCEVSDDEMYNPGKGQKGTWEPTAEDILKVFEDLKSKKVLELHWKCPGRRHPDSDVKPDENNKETVAVTPTKQEEKRPAVPNEFDFDEDDDLGGAKAVLTPRRTPGSAPKSQKKEARMDKILKDIMQQRKLQAAEREARKLAGSKSPRTPGSPGRARLGSPAGSPRTPNRQSPVRIGVNPSEPITTTPARPPLDVQSGLRPSKPEGSPNPSFIYKKTENDSANVTSAQNVQTSKTGTPVQNIYGNQSQVSFSGETTPSQPVVSRQLTPTSGLIALPAHAVKDPDNVMKATGEMNELRLEGAKTEVKETAEQMDTS